MEPPAFSAQVIMYSQWAGFPYSTQAQRSTAPTPIPSPWRSQTKTSAVRRHITYLCFQSRRPTTFVAMHSPSHLTRSFTHIVGSKTNGKQHHSSLRLRCAFHTRLPALELRQSPWVWSFAKSRIKPSQTSNAGCGGCRPARGRRCPHSCPHRCSGATN